MRQCSTVNSTDVVRPAMTPFIVSRCPIRLRRFVQRPLPRDFPLALFEMMLMMLFFVVQDRTSKKR